MYLPEDFREDRVAELHAAMRRIALGTLVTLGADGLEASHVPMLVEAEPAPHGRLQGHLARANPQWRRLSPATPALAIFLGPEGYVTPSWYATKRATGKVVPTWNYVAVHAYGALRIIDDADWLHALVTRLTEAHEAGRAAPWAVSDAPKDYVAGMVRAIVGFELTITRLQGKWKMSQNRPAEDRAGVIAGLTADAKPTLATLVAGSKPKERE
jgi:transcriptional regulator